MVDRVRQVDASRLEVALHPRLLQSEEGGLRPVVEDLLVEVRILGLQRRHLLTDVAMVHGRGQRRRRGAVTGGGHGPVEGAPAPVPVVEGEQDEKEEDEGADSSPATEEDRDGEVTAATAVGAAPETAPAEAAAAKVAAPAETLAAPRSKEHGHQDHGRIRGRAPAALRRT